MAGFTICGLTTANPITEESEYVDAIINEMYAGLGFDWKAREYHASDYFEVLYGYAVKLIEKGLGLRLRFDTRGDAGLSWYLGRTRQK